MSPTADAHRVVFTPSGLSGSVPDGTTALEAARLLGVDLDSVCGGRGICGRCQLVPVTGTFSKWAITAEAEHLGDRGPLELDYRGRRAIGDGHRLGCGVRIVGDAVLDVPPESQIHRQVVRKSVDLDGLVVDPIITLHYLEPERPAPGADDDIEAESLTATIARLLDADWSIGPVRFRPATLPRLHSAVGGGSLTVAVRAGAGGAPVTVVGVWPGFVDRVVGVAVDIGSTTVAGHLCDLTTGEVLAGTGRMNPQIRFGEDLMSRVSYVMMNPGGEIELTDAIRGALDELVGELLDRANGGRSDTIADAVPLTRTEVLDIVTVGNPVMHHLALGIDPTPLGQAPFTLATADPVETEATEVGIDAPWSSFYFAPCIAGHVGADTAAAILSEKPHRGDAVQLLVDVGTNAEIVLGNQDRLFAASSPTGPAFEGAQISSGQRATVGAIERVRIDRSTGEPRFKVIGSELWSDDDGFAAAVDPSAGGAGVTGICGSGIIEVVSELFLSGLIDAQGVIGPRDGSAVTDRIEADGRTFRYRLTDGIAITQADVRAIQLAKAALRAGCDLLMEHAGLGEVDEIRLAGAFGAHIDPMHAMVLGLIPDCPLDRVQAVGNAAGSGAVRALLSRVERRELEAVVAEVTKIETATEPRFQELFVGALAFPHDTAPSPNLATEVALPTRPADGDGNGGRGRRRRRGNRTSTASERGLS